jgi:lipopolysaccharide export system protein LptA
MKKLFILLLAGSGGLMVWAQTNIPAQKPGPKAEPPPPRTYDLGADAQDYSGDKTRLMVYAGNVWVTNLQGKLTCERLTVNLPFKNGDHVTNAVAEISVVVDSLDKKGLPQRITSDKAIYTYELVGVLTNETILFTNNATFTNSELSETADSITYDLQTGGIHGANPHMHFNATHSTGTNASPLDILK